VTEWFWFLDLVLQSNFAWKYFHSLSVQVLVGLKREREINEHQISTQHKRKSVKFKGFHFWKKNLFFVSQRVFSIRMSISTFEEISTDDQLQ
jgi:hypothetical protein